MLPSYIPLPVQHETKTNVESGTQQKPHLVSSQSISVQNYASQRVIQQHLGNVSLEEQTNKTNQSPVDADKTKSEPLCGPSNLNQGASGGHVNEEKETSNSSNPPAQQTIYAEHNNQKLMQPPAMPSVFNSALTDVSPSDLSSLNSLFPYLDAPDWLPCPSTTIPEVIDPSLPPLGQDLWDQNQSLKYPTQSDRFGS